MKRFIYLLTTALFVASCGENKGYVINGTVEGGEDGETVYLQTRENRQYVSRDSAVIVKGTFQFNGVQDSTIVCMIAYKPNSYEGLTMPIFLENGTINVQLTRMSDVATGTLNNDAYQEVRTAINELNKEATTLNESLADTSLTDENRAQLMGQMNELADKQYDIIKTGIKKNINNLVGVYLLKDNHYSLQLEELEELLPQIPAAYNDDAGIQKIKENVATMKQTAVGKKFIDFELQTPEGKSIKLSDYAGKGKIVLVDFWASWCGPCRKEMPNLIKTYAQFKNKGFEIVGVSLDRNGDAWKKGIKDLGITWPQMSDLQYWNCLGAKLYAVSSIPHTVLIDGEGTIIAKNLRGEAIDEKLSELLK
ncbi:MAG: AhpC/TSA family protein [Mediterranea sp.]|jgi:peroxiredoxin|nr:AhpC/TSA family protein [Mediterranea sp.]